MGGIWLRSASSREGSAEMESKIFLLKVRSSFFAWAGVFMFFTSEPMMEEIAAD